MAAGGVTLDPSYGARQQLFVNRRYESVLQGEGKNESQGKEEKDKTREALKE